MSRRNPARRPTRSRSTLAGVLLIGVIAGIGIGRWTASQSAPASPHPAVADAASPPPVTTAPRRRPEAEAVVAATRAMSALARPDLLGDARRRRAVVAEVATPAYRDELAGLFDRAYVHMEAALGGSPPSAILLRLVPLGHRIESIDEEHARVAVWHVLLVGAPGGRVVASWSTSRADLVREGDRWLVAGFIADEPGPGPAVTNTRSVSPPEIFIARAAAFTAFAP